MIANRWLRYGSNYFGALEVSLPHVLKIKLADLIRRSRAERQVVAHDSSIKCPNFRFDRGRFRSSMTF